MSQIAIGGNFETHKPSQMLELEGVSVRRPYFDKLRWLNYLHVGGRVPYRLSKMLELEGSSILKN